jgi:hypothetical protein
MLLILALAGGNHAVLAGTQERASGEVPIDCVLSGDGLIAYAPGGMSTLPVSGVLLKEYRGGVLWYVRAAGARREGSSPAAFAAGCIDFRSDRRAEYSWKQEGGGVPSRIAGTGGSAYVLMAPPAAAGKRSGTLMLIDINAGSARKLEGVTDFALAGGRLCLLANASSGIVLNVDGKNLPLPVGPSARIVAVVQEWLLVVTDDESTVIADARECRLLAARALKRQLARPAEYNFEFLCADESAAGDPSAAVFYKVFIDGAEAGRTDSGPAGTPRRFRTKLDAAAVHVVKAERWELNRLKEKYERANNINQPTAVKVLVPAGAVLRLDCIMAEGGYRFTSALVTE